MNFLERLGYFWLFLFNKYLGWNLTEYFLNSFENRMIRKYIQPIERDPDPIPTIEADSLTDQMFVQLSHYYRRPILIKGYMKNALAIKNWNLDYLTQTIDDFRLMVLHLNSRSSKIEMQMMPFNQFSDQIENSHYVNNNHTILSRFPQLFNDIQPEYTKLIETLSSTNLRNIHIANLFIGTNCPNSNVCSGSNMHAGGSGNFFCMIQGTKHWTLIDPKYSCLLKGRVAQSGIHAQTLFDMPNDTSLLTTPKMLKYLPRYEVTLEPGDILWNAPWWWHRIENGPGFSVGMAIRNNKVTQLNLLNNLTYTLSGTTYLIYNTWLIELYERLRLQRDQHFGVSHEEEEKSNVLYQIQALLNRYPRSVQIDQILGH